MVFDNQYLDAFARVTWHEKEIKSLSGSKLDYVGVKAATAVDFRGDNMLNFESLEKIQLTYTLQLKACIYKIGQKKIKNKSSSDDDSWGDLDK